MNLRQSAALLAAAAIVVWLAPSGTAQNQERYKVRLTTVPMDGGMRNTVAGSGSATAGLAGGTLAITGTFEGLLRRRPPPRCAAARREALRASIAELTVSKATKGTLTGSINLTAEQVKGLREGRMYIELASEKAPEGNLWGWILK